MRIDCLPHRASAFLLSPDAAVLSLEEVQHRFAEILRQEDGIPVDRLSWHSPTLHPEIRTTQIVWRSDASTAFYHHPHSGPGTPTWKSSPFRHLLEEKLTVFHRRLVPVESPHEFPVLNDFVEQGYTDYVAMLQQGGDAYENAPITYCTRKEGGFTESQLEQLQALLPLVTLVLHLAAQRRRVRHLMETYVGHDAARRVLDGYIRRGEQVTIRAAICFCDIRDFTRLSQDLSQESLLKLLNEAFEVVVEAVETENGEVLKFIGDAVLAVFQKREEDPDDGAAVRRALSAATAVVKKAEALSLHREAAGEVPLRLGLSVHVGDVAYGNVGARTRLDFTVIGAAVNIASRLEPLCKTFAAPIVLSEAAARWAEGASLHCEGPQTLKGVAEPVVVYTFR